MQILGYSERGVINSFFYEMAYTHKVAFQDFLNLIQPMITGVEFPKFELKEDSYPTIIIEPSFSEFGDADAVILFEDKNIGNTVLFIEAKVCKRENWTFETESGSDGLWLHSQYGGQESACAFIQHLLQKYDFAPAVAFEWSHDCSKPSTDAYGVGAAFITATEIETMTTSEWLRKMSC